MKRMRAVSLRLAGLFRKRSSEQELANELDSHLQMHIDDNLRSGMAPDEARREAMLKLGGIEAAKEAYRDRATIPMLDSLSRDTRFAVRQLCKSPGFSFITTLILALGLCASVALFAFVDAALIKPLPYPNPDRLVNVTESIPLLPRATISYLDYLDWKRMNRVFKSFAVFTGTSYLLDSPAGAQPVQGARITDGFFRTLGIKPLIGRDFYDGEDLKGTPNTAILSFSIWQKRFSGAKSAVGQKIRLSGVPYTIVGVLPDSFQFAPQGGAKIWTPIHAAGGSCEERRSCHNLDGVARLKDGVSVQAALADMTSIARQLERQYPSSNRSQGASVAPLAEVIVGDIRPIFLVLLGGGILLLVLPG